MASCTKLKILEKNGMFSGKASNGKEYSICYWLVIAQTVFASKEWDKQKWEAWLNELKVFFSGDGVTFKLKGFSGFFDAYRLADGSGFCIVDRSFGCFPLILYEKEDKHNTATKNERASLFRDELDDVIKKLGACIDIFETHKEWDENLRAALEEVILKQ